MATDDTCLQDRRAFIASSAASAVALGISGCNAPTPAGDGGGGDARDGGGRDARDGAGGDARDGGRDGGMDDSPCIDVHTHMILHDPAATTPEAGRDSADVLVESLDSAHVDKAIILAVTERLLWGLPGAVEPGVWTLDDIVKQNELCLAARHRHPDRLEAFVGLDWRGFGQADWAAQAVAQVTNAVNEGGASGLKLHIGQATTVVYLNRAVGLDDAHQFLSDDSLKPVLEALWTLGGAPLIHVGDVPSVGYPEDAPPFSDVNAATYLHLLRLLEAYPDRPFIAAHMACLAPDMNPHVTVPGAPVDFSTLRTLLDSHPNLSVDISGITVVPSRVGLSEQGAQSTRQLFLDYPDRLLFGTDFGPFNKNLPAYEIYEQWLTGPFGQTFSHDYFPGLEIWSLGLDGDVIMALRSGNYARIQADLEHA